MIEAAFIGGFILGAMSGVLILGLMLAARDMSDGKDLF